MNRRAHRGSIRGRLLWIAATLVVAGAAMWRATRRPQPGPVAGSNAVGVSQPRRRELTKGDLVSELVRAGNDDAIKKLVASYIAWAGMSDTLDARRDILDTLFQLKSPPRRLQALLDAMAGDPTPPQDDPLWTYGVDKMSRAWQEDEARLSQAQEVMLLESRPRARRFMATAMAQLAQSEPARRLSEPRRIALAQDLIDVYFGEEAAAYNSELEPAILSLSGSDVALLLREGPEHVKLNEMGILVRREQVIQQATRDLATK